MANANYLRAYETAKQELAEVLLQLQGLEQKKMVLRQTIEALEAQCKAAGIDLQQSEEATYLRENTALADEIRSVLNAQPLTLFRPAEVKEELARVGHDLGKYGNPQAAIHMVLKRLVQSGEAEEKVVDGKQCYRAKGFWGAFPNALIHLNDLAKPKSSIDYSKILSRLKTKK